MRHYEIVFLVHPDQSEQVPGMIERYSAAIKKDGGKVHRLEDWGRRQLAYDINKIHKAHYVLMNVEASDQAIGELSTTFRYNDAIIRNMVIRRDEAVTGESLIMKQEREQKERKSRQEERQAREASARAEAAEQMDDAAEEMDEAAMELEDADVEDAELDAFSEEDGAEAEGAEMDSADRERAETGAAAPAAAGEQPAIADATQAPSAANAPQTESAEEPSADSSDSGKS